MALLFVERIVYHTEMDLVILTTVALILLATAAIEMGDL